MDEKMITQPAIPCADLVCTNVFTGCSVITISPSLTPLGTSSNIAIITNDITCATDFITCTAAIDSGCGTVAGEITVLGFVISGSISYVADVAVQDFCGNEGFISTRDTVSIPTSLVCITSPDSPLTCENFDLCPTVTGAIAPIPCPISPNVFEIIATFTFACPVV
jgi:hypothetical protein